MPQAPGPLPGALPGAHKPGKLFHQTGRCRWFLLRGERRGWLEGFGPRHFSPLHPQQHVSRYYLNFPLTPVPCYFWFRGVAAPKEKQLVSRGVPRGREQGGAVTRAGGCVAALFLIAGGVQKFGPELGCPEERRAVLPVPLASLVASAGRRPGRSCGQRTGGDTRRERAPLSPSGWLRGEGGQDAESVRAPAEPSLF